MKIFMVSFIILLSAICMHRHAIGEPDIEAGAREELAGNIDKVFSDLADKLRMRDGMEKKLLIKAMSGSGADAEIVFSESIVLVVPGCGQKPIEVASHALKRDERILLFTVTKLYSTSVEAPMATVAIANIDKDRNVVGSELVLKYSEGEWVSIARP